MAKKYRMSRRAAKRQYKKASTGKKQYHRGSGHGRL